MLRVLTPSILCAAALALPTPSLACKPLIHPVSDYTLGRIPDRVVFFGRVATVREIERSRGTIMYELELAPSQWFSGEEHSSIVVRGMKGSAPGTDCADQFDLVATVGEEWLIFGQLYDGKVNPDVFLSTRVIDGRLPKKY